MPAGNIITAGSISSGSDSLNPTFHGGSALGNYYIGSESFTIGGQTWALEYAKSPLLHGGVLISAVMDKPINEFTVFVEGSTDAAMFTNLDNLRKAFYQFSYRVNLTILGQTFTWQCDPANVFPSFSDDHLRARKMPVKIVYPRDPIPIAGVF